MMGDIIIRLVNLPAAIRAYTLTYHNDDYNIYVNNALNSVEQQKAVNHELNHINADHFYRDAPVSQDEQEAEIKPVKVTPVHVKPVAPDFRQLRAKTGYTALSGVKVYRHLHRSLYPHRARPLQTNAGRTDAAYFIL